MESLESLYNKIKDAVSKVDFALLWEGFEPLKFALYTDTECFFDGHYIEKTTDFCANTAVEADEVVLKGPAEIVTVNIYDARCYNGYLTSRFFMMYLENGENKVIRDNYVIKMKDEKTIDTVYRRV